MSPRNQRRAEWPWRHTLSETIRSARRERGTVLLMVIGVLALLAIIGVVYATIGRADRSVSVTVQRQQRITDQAEEIAAYIAKVIGSATFAKYSEPTESGIGTGKIDRTRGYTYPWTDDRFLSINPADYAGAFGAQGLPSVTNVATEYSTFAPTGENTKLWSGTITDPRNHADPYLATLEPEWLRFTPVNSAGELYSIRDWRHISNLSPSGNFVSLANLRRSNNGGFDAPPGFRAGSAASVAQMSYGLTLRQTNGQMWAVGTSRLADGATLANFANPAHWSNNQIMAFQPAVPDGTYQPNQYEYVLNQWADADGDGFLDSRWFELTDLSQMFGSGSTFAARQVVPARGRYRLFCAARVIDSSGKINVNVASDVVNGPWPTRDFLGKHPDGSTKYLTRDDAIPPGLTPADIALNRVLRLSDINVALPSVDPTGAAAGLSYHGIPQPAVLGTSDDYTGYAAALRADNVGNAAYTALIDARRRGSTAISGVGTQPSQEYYSNAGERTQHYDLFASDPRSARGSSLYNAVAGTRVVRSPFDLADELELITFFGVNDSDTVSRLEATLGGRSTGAGLGALSPLRDNRSRSLEMTGRDEFDGSASTNPNSIFNPSVGRASLLAAYTDIRHMLTTVSGARPIKGSGVAPDPAGDADPSKFNPASTDVSAALKAIRDYAEADPATGPTATQKLARQLAAQLIFKLYANALVPYTDTTDFTSAWTNTSASALTRMGLVYGGNSEMALRVAAHMTANLVDAFDRDRRDNANTGVLATPGRFNGDDRNEPTSVFVNLAAPATAAPAVPLAGGLSTQRAYPASTNNNNVITLDLNANLPTGKSRLPTTLAGLPSSAPYANQAGKMTVYGVEPQPFLTEYGVMAMYTDAPNGHGGDDDAEGVVGSPSPGSANITIRIKPDFTNSDFICEVLVFQLNNPFDQDVILYDKYPSTGSMAIAEKHKYYLEYAGRYYTFREQDEDTLAFGTEKHEVLKAGRTRTFYVVNPGTLKAVGQRIADMNAALRSNDRDPPPTSRTTADEFKMVAKDWIEHQLRNTINGIADRPIQLTQVNPHDFKAILTSSGSPAEPMPDMDLFGEAQLPETVSLTATTGRSESERRVCNLWRTVRSQSSLYPGNIPGTTATPSSINSDETSLILNDDTNDILADRMHDPSELTSSASGYLWDERIKHSGAHHEVSSASGGDDHGSDSEVGANTGYTAVTWAAIRRPTDVKTFPGVKGGTQDGNGRQFRGVLPPWCLEARCDSKWPHLITTSNAPIGGQSDPGNKFGLNRRFNGPNGNDQASGSEYPDDMHFKTLHQALASNTPVNEEIAKACPRKGNGAGTYNARANPIGRTKDSVTGTGSANYTREYSQVAVEFHCVGEDTLGGAENVPQLPAGVPPSTPGIRRSRNPALFSRSGDFLLPLAVGPWFDPSRKGSQLTGVSSTALAWIVPANTNTILADREASRMTLSEALALACGYYSPQDANDPFFEFGNYAVAAGNNASHPPKADRGHLVLDAFTPFLKTAAAVNPQPLGSGVPFALSIIDQFRAATGIASTTMNKGTVAAPVYGPEQQTRDVSYGGGSSALSRNLDAAQTLKSLTRVEGKINVNTTTEQGVRTLPLVSPELIDPGILPFAKSWMRQPGNFFAASGGPSLLDESVNRDYDLAPTIVGYRDRKIAKFRQDPLGVPLTRAEVDFKTKTRLQHLQDTQPGLLPDGYRREGLGIQSIGEFAAINFASAGSTTTNPILDCNSIFRFGERDQNVSGMIVNMPTGTFGTGSTRVAQRISFQPSILSSRCYNLDLNGVPFKNEAQYPNPSNTGAPYFTLGGNELPRGYQEKLAIVNALTNTASVYSDVFTVYFVIHGYTPEDCDIEDSQPLVPSVAKRYVMIVDRSTVVAAGDKPRILMLKEVPMQ